MPGLLTHLLLELNVGTVVIGLPPYSGTHISTTLQRQIDKRWISDSQLKRSKLCDWLKSTPVILYMYKRYGLQARVK